MLISIYFLSSRPFIGYSSMLQKFCSILFNLLLTTIAILLCLFFLFFVVSNNFLKSPAHNENVRLRLALAFPTGIPIAVANYAIDMPPLVADKTIKVLSK